MKGLSLLLIEGNLWPCMSFQSSFYAKDTGHTEKDNPPFLRLRIVSCYLPSFVCVLSMNLHQDPTM